MKESGKLVYLEKGERFCEVKQQKNSVGINQMVPKKDRRV